MSEQSPRTPYSYQEEALAKIVPALQAEPRATAVLACGAGKTLVGYWTRERLNAKKTLMLLPSLGLMSQTLKEWGKESKFPYLCVCSDKVVEAAAKAEDSIRFTAEEFGNITTDAKVVQDFLEKNETCVVFSTYQSSPVVAKAMQSGDAFDLGIFDEAHHATGKREEGKAFTFALEDANLPIKRRLFMTATPRHYAADASKTYSMNQAEVYGAEAFVLSFAEAMRQEIIVPLKTIISEITDAEVKKRMQSGYVAMCGTPLPAREVVNLIAVEKAVAKYDLKKVVSFHSTRKLAEEFKDAMKNHLPEPWEVFYIDGAMNAKQREQILTAFTNAPRALITNAQCLGEGIDIKGIDGVVFASPKRSRIQIAQAASRSLRRFEEKTHGHAILPVYLEARAGKKATAAATAKALKSAAMSGLGNTLRALGEIDAAFVELAKLMRAKIGRGEPISNKEFGDLLDGANIVVDGPPLKLDVLREAVALRVLDELSDGWDEMFGKWVAHLKKYKGVYPSHNTKLGKWVNHQRDAFKNNSLSKDRVARLNGGGFVWKALDEKWKAHVAEFVKNGNKPIPNNSRLGRWKNRINQANKGKGNFTLTPERKAELNSLNFPWAAPRTPWGENTCPEGHVGYVRTGQRGKKNCSECHRLIYVKRRAAAGKPPVKEPNGLWDGDTCPRGHVGHAKQVKTTGARYCGECRRLYLAKKQAAKLAH